MQFVRPRLPRLLFLFHLAAAIYRLEHSERVHPGVARLAIITSFIAYVIHLLACLWFFVGGYVQGWQEGLQEDARPLGQIVVEGTGPRVHLEGAREPGLSHGYSDTALFFS